MKFGIVPRPGRRGDPPACGGASSTAEQQQRISMIGHPDVLGRIFEHLPAEDQFCTISRLSRAWRHWAAPRAAAARRPPSSTPVLGAGWAPAWSPPLWQTREVWPRLGRQQRALAAVHAAHRGDAAALEWMYGEFAPGARGGGGGGDGPFPASHVCVAAAAGGHLPVLHRLQELGLLPRR